MSDFFHYLIFFKQSIFVEQSTKISGRSFFLDNEMKYFSLFELIRFLRKELRPESFVPFGFGLLVEPQIFFLIFKTKKSKICRKMLELWRVTYIHTEKVTQVLLSAHSEPVTNLKHWKNLYYFHVLLFNLKLRSIRRTIN